MNIEVKGAKILFNIFDVKITEAQIGSWVIIFFVFLVCLWLTHNLKIKNCKRRQVIAEYLVKHANKFVSSNMGNKFLFFTPFLTALMVLSSLSSLSALIAWKPPTSDLNTVLGWSLLVFALIIYYKIKTLGIGGYFKSYTKPVCVLTPFNILSDITTPVSMSFRHFGNIVSGVVVSSLIYGALASFSSVILKNAPSIIANIPILQLGIPAIFSIYFDLFSSLLQAFIFCMLTMVYIKMAANVE